MVSIAPDLPVDFEGCLVVGALEGELLAGGDLVEWPSSPGAPSSLWVAAWPPFLFLLGGVDTPRDGVQPPLAFSRGGPTATPLFFPVVMWPPLSYF